MTKDIIKQEAMLLFVQEGYDGCSMANIAKKVNIRPSSIYAHFESKEQLFLTILQDITNEKTAEIERIKKETSHKGIKILLYTILMGRMKEIETHKERVFFYKRYSLFPPTHLKEKIQDLMFTHENEFTEIMTPAFENAIRQGELKKDRPEKALLAFYCVLDGLYVLSHYYDMDNYRKVVDDVWSLYWESVDAV